MSQTKQGPNISDLFEQAYHSDSDCGDNDFISFDHFQKKIMREKIKQNISRLAQLRSKKSVNTSTSPKKKTPQQNIPQKPPKNIPQKNKV